LPKITATIRNWWNQRCSSNGSLLLPFVMKKVMMVWHFVSDSHKVMTVLIVLLPWSCSFLCILISCIWSQLSPVLYLVQPDLVFPAHVEVAVEVIMELWFLQLLALLRGQAVACWQKLYLCLMFVAHCVMWIYLWFLFYLAVSILWVSVRLPFFSSFHGTWSNCIVYLPQTMQELLLTQKERWRVRSPCFHCLFTAF
jgi:hypothetical protein